jgi:hypothetical protein
MIGMDERVTYDHGDRRAALAGEILRGLVGSTAHGMELPGTDDRDETGVFLEPAAHVAGIRPPLDTFQSRTQPDGARSGYGDVDLVLYSLRHFLRLATAGNPSILVLLFTPTLITSSPVGEELRALTPAIVSRRASHRFLGFLDAQRQRMVGEGKQNRVPKRPELVAAHGYDTKYAAHALRLGLQGVTLATTGRLRLPMPDDERAVLLTVRRGEVSFGEALSLVDEQRERLDRIVARGAGVLPAEPDLARVDEWAVGAHQRFWRAGVVEGRRGPVAA